MFFYPNIFLASSRPEQSVSEPLSRARGGAAEHRAPCTARQARPGTTRRFLAAARVRCAPAPRGPVLCACILILAAKFTRSQQRARCRCAGVGEPDGPAALRAHQSRAAAAHRSRGDVPVQPQESPHTTAVIRTSEGTKWRCGTIGVFCPPRGGGRPPARTGRHVRRARPARARPDASLQQHASGAPPPPRGPVLCACILILAAKFTRSQQRARCRCAGVGGPDGPAALRAHQPRAAAAHRSRGDLPVHPQATVIRTSEGTKWRGGTICVFCPPRGGGQPPARTGRHVRRARPARARPDASLQQHASGAPRPNEAPCCAHARSLLQRLPPAASVCALACANRAVLSSREHPGDRHGPRGTTRVSAHARSPRA